MDCILAVTAMLLVAKTRLNRLLFSKTNIGLNACLTRRTYMAFTILSYFKNITHFFV